MESRIKMALEFLREGKPFSVGELRLELNNVNVLTVRGWSQYSIFLNLTKANSLKELSEIKQIFSMMVDASEELKFFLANKSIEYILCYDDGGKASINICSEINGVFKWLVDLK